MSEVSPTLLNVLKTWNAAADQARRDLSIVVEFYAADASPPFDPPDALACFSKGNTVDADGESIPITFRGVEYVRQLSKTGDIKRSMTKEANNNSPSFSNVDRYVSSFANSLEGGIEGLHYVVRLLSRSQSVELADSHVLYTGIVGRNIKGNAKEFGIESRQHLISTEIEIPPRKMGVDDPEGRDVDDPEHEGFPFKPQKFQGAPYKESVPRGGFFGRFLGNRTVEKTTPADSKTGMSASQSLPLIGGRAMLAGIPIAFVDVGNSINMLHAYADGCSYGIQDILDIKNAGGDFTDIVFSDYRRGYKAGEGLAGRIQAIYAGTNWAGNFLPYSRAATSASFVNGSALDAEDAAPEVTAIIQGAVVPIPDSTGSYLAKTGGITSGSPTLTVSSLGYRNGDLLWVEGAATGGKDMYARVSSGGGTTTLTLSANAGSTVAGASVRLIGWTDNPVHLSRWIITDPHLMAFPESWMDDGVNVESAAYCDQFLEDEANTDRVALPDSENPATNGGVRAGVDYRRLRSTSHVSPEWFRRGFLGDLTVDPYDIEASYDYFDPAVSLPDLTPARTYRRRYNANFGIVDSIKAVDFLFDVLFPAARLYLTQGANSKIGIRVKKPVDHSFLSVDVAAGATEVPVESVFAWMNSLRGVIRIGTEEDTEQTSEIRTVTAARYSTAGNSTTLSVSGALSASGATFSGGDGASVPPTATLTVTGTGTLTATIDGVAVAYTTTGSDTTATSAGMLAAAISANPVLNLYIKAQWNQNATITLTSKLGFLEFDEPLEFDHDASEVVMRGAMSFSKGASVQSDALRSNLLKGSFGWSGTGSSGRGEYNQVRLKYRDASQDYQLTEIRIPKPSEITDPIRPKEFNGNAIDNYHQAYRIAAGLHAEMVDSNTYTQHSSDGEALLVDEGEVVFVTHDAGDFVNLPVLVEKVKITEDLKAAFDCKRYLLAMFSDEVIQKQVPLPTTLNWQNSAPGVPTNLALTEMDVSATSSTVRATFDFADYVGAQIGRVQLKRGAAAFVEVGTVQPDASNSATFDIPGLIPATYQVKVQAEGRGLLSAFTSIESITTETSGEIDVDTLNIGTAIDFNTDAARELSLRNIGGAPEITRWL